MSLLSRYQDFIAQNNYQFDPVQAKCLSVFQMLLDHLTVKKTFLSMFKKMPNGIYLYGDVGRGKSMLMDLFFNAVPYTIKKERIHFHEFMKRTHEWLHENRGKGMDDLLPRYAKDASKNIQLLCFDEFHVIDVTDAMILSRLFTYLIEEGVIIVATSNWKPDDLYTGGLQRDLFLPFIDLIKEKMTVIYLDHDLDYRQSGIESEQSVFYHPLNDQTKRLFQNLFSVHAQGKVERVTITIKGRELSLIASGNTLLTSFHELCEQPLGAEDYLAISQRFHTVFLDDVPALTSEKRNEAKRFILLIDCLYEQKTKLYIRSEVSVENLYHGDDHAFEYDRTLSRLTEMQSVDWLAD